MSSRSSAYLPTAALISFLTLAWALVAEPLLLGSGARLGSFGRSANALQGAEVVGDRQGVVRVGDQADVSIWAYEDQGVMAVCPCRVPGVVDEAAWPDQVGLDDVGLEVVECGGAAFTQAEQGEMGSAEEVEQAFRRAGERVAAGGVWCPVARPWSVGSAPGVAGEPAPPVSERELGEFGRCNGVHAAAQLLDRGEDGVEP